MVKIGRYSKEDPYGGKYKVAARKAREQKEGFDVCVSTAYGVLHLLL